MRPAPIRIYNRRPVVTIGPGRPAFAAHRWRGLMLNLSLSLAVTVAFVAAGEGLARWLEKPAPPGPLADTRGLDWQATWQDDFYVIRSEAVGWPPAQDFNRDGLRDRTHPLEKPARTYRLVGLGDSVTLGYGFARSEAWPQALQAMVDARGPGVEVFNVALVGWSTRQERYAYERIARRYRPDAVVLALALNDIEDLQNNLSRPPRLLVELFQRSALVRRLMDVEGREIRSVEELFVQPETAKVASGFRRLFAEIRALADAVHRDGATLVVMVFPDADQVGPHPPPPAPQERIGAFLRSEGLPFIDALPALREVGPSGFMDRIHFTPRGSARVAEEVLQSAAIPAGAYTTEPLRHALADHNRSSKPGAVSLDALATLVSDGSPAVRREAAWALGRREGAAVPALAVLASALGDHEPSVRAEGARALALIGPAGRTAGSAGASAEAHLVALLDDPRQEVRWAATDALAARGVRAEEDVPWLVSALGNPDPYVRGFAAWMLGVAGPAAAAVPALENRLHDVEPGVRTLAVRALGNVAQGDPAAVAALADVLAHGAGEGRWRAARALGKLGPAAAPAAAALADALSDPDEKLRRESALALDRIGPSARAAVAALVAAEHDPVPEVREAAEDALRTITASR
jgi:HEAT repeat protein/lysophospholipase L1-like esterase